MPITQLFSEYAEGDGNCAFNAFILGLSDARILDHLPELGEASPDKRYKLFIERAQTVFTGTPLTWQRLRDSLIRYKSLNKVKLQKALAPVVRAFAIELIKKDLDAYYESTINPLNAELGNYFNIMQERKKNFSLLNAPIDHNTPGMGDIFIRHQFVKDAFDFLWQNCGEQDKGLDKAQAALQVKWKEKGIGLFLTSMNSDAILAGDLELAPLAKYFGINLDVDMGIRGRHSIVRFSRMPASVVLEDGKEFKLDRAVCQRLSTRAVIDVEGVLEEITPAEVDERLGVIPNYDKVVAYLNVNKPVKGAPVPADWSQACLRQLLVRSIITKNNVFVSDLSDEPVDKRINGKENREETLRRIAAFPHAKEIAAAWKTVPNAPLMTLQNSAAVHWNNIVTIVVPDIKPESLDSDSKSENYSAHNETKTPVKSPDLREITTLKFIGRKSDVILDEILRARKMLEDVDDVTVRNASDVLFQYHRGIEKPVKAAERFNFAVRYHTLLGLYQWSENKAINAAYVRDFRASLQVELAELIKKFPLEFDILSAQDDWDKCIKPCLAPKIATQLLKQKLDRLEKVFTEYDREKWIAANAFMPATYVQAFNKLWKDAVAKLHPSYVEAFNKLRVPLLSAQMTGSAYGAPFHIWSPPRDEAKQTKPVVEQEMRAPKYIR